MRALHGMAVAKAVSLLLLLRVSPPRVRSLIPNVILQLQLRYAEYSVISRQASMYVPRGIRSPLPKMSACVPSDVSQRQRNRWIPIPDIPPCSNPVLQRSIACPARAFCLGGGARPRSAHLLVYVLTEISRSVGDVMSKWPPPNVTRLL